MFINGLEVASGTITQPTSASNPMRIGYDTTPTVNAGFYGNIDEVRITKNVARYTSNFTPLSTAFPNQ